MIRGDRGLAPNCTVDFAGVGSAGWAERATAQLEVDVRAGARGLIIYKELGRAPHSARPWFIRYADHILFGTNCLPTIAI